MTAPKGFYTGENIGCRFSLDFAAKMSCNQGNISVARSLFRLSFLSFLLCFLSACDGNYLVWSSDGKLAAAIGAKGLRVSDIEGNISRVLYEKAGLFRWLPQEHQGVVVGYDYSSSWSELKDIVTVEQQKQILKESALLRRRILAYKGEPRKFAENNFRDFVYPLEAVIHLRAGSDPDFLKSATKKWTAFSKVKVPIFHIKQVLIEDKSLKIVKLINKSIDEIVEIRVSPNGKYIACAKHENGRERNYIEVIPTTAFSKPKFVDALTNVYPDWSSDGRSVYYSRLSLASEGRLLKDTSVPEGGLFKSEILDGAGKFLAKPKNSKLARLIFEPKAQVRGLADGRVFFVSREIHLPAGFPTVNACSIFSLSGAKIESIFSKKDDVVFFEISPDQKQCAVVLSNGALYLAGSDGVENSELCNGKDLKVSGIYPQWRNDQEVSYGVEQPSAIKGAKPGYGIYLSERGRSPRDLSKSWGKEAVSEIIVHKDVFQEAMAGVADDIESADLKSKAK